VTYKKDVWIRSGDCARNAMHMEDPEVEALKETAAQTNKKTKHR
jgi:hypothetical protein